MPSSGTFEKRFDLSRAIESYTLNDRYSDLSDGTLGINNTFVHANELIVVDRANHANDKGSVIRVLRGQTPVAHFVARRIDRKWSSNFNVKPVLLDGAEFFLDRQTVPNFDYPNVPMRNPDWIYGAESVFEGPGGEIAFEQQAIYRESTVTTGVFRLNFGGNQTPDLDFNSSASEIQTALEDLASIDQVTVDGAGTPFAPWVIEFIVPEGDVAQMTISNSTLDGNMFITTLRAGGTLDPRPWSPSFHPVTKLFHSTYDLFEMVETPLYLDSTHSLAVNANIPPFSTDYGGAQVMVNVVGGGFYRAEIPIFSPTAQVVRFVIRNMNEGHIVSIEHTTAVNTWEVLEIEGIEIPIGVDQVIFRLGLVTSGDPGIIYISPEYALLAPGFKAAPLGKILGEILIFIQAQGDFLWVTKTFTDTTDSKGVDWDQDLSWGVQHGQTLLQLHEYANKWNYRWGFDWSVANSRWEWHAYNPGTTLTTVTNIGIVGHDGVIGSGTISTKVPEATHYQADGDGGEWGEFTDPVMPTIWGRLHKFYSNAQGMASTELTILAERLVDHASEYTEGLMVELQNPEYLPWEDYKKGDSLTVVMTPEFPVGSIPIMAIVANKEVKRDPVYNVHLNSVVYEGEAAIAENLRRLIRAFKAEQFNQAKGTIDPAAFSRGSGGAMATVLIAASNATSYSQQKADFVCSGADDHVMIQLLIDQIQQDGFEGGTVWLTEGTYFCTSEIELGSINLRGIGGMNDDSGPFLDFVVTDGSIRAIEMSSGSSLQNLHIRWETEDTTLTTIVSSGSGPSYIDHVTFEAFGASEPWASTGTVINLGAGNEHWVTNVLMECECPLGIVTNGGNSKFIDNVTIKFASEYGIKHSSGSEFHVSNVYLENCGTLDDLTTGGIFCFGGELLALNNIQMSGQQGIGLFVSTGYSIVGTGLHIELSGEIAYGVGVSNMPATTSLTISGLTVLQGSKQISIEDSLGLVSINGFVLRATREDGIVITDSSKIRIADGQIGSVSVVDDDAHDAIRIEGDSNRNYISGVMIRPKATANQWRYGINIADATCDENILRDIVLDDAANYATGDINDAGTGSILTNNVSF